MNEPKERVAALVEKLARSYDERGSGLMVREIAGGYQIAPRPEYRDRLDAILEASHPAPLSLPALETLAIIGYKQPIHAGGNPEDSRGQRKSCDQDAPAA